MSAWSCLHSLRVGCVQYLNAKPLIEAYDGPVQFAHPSELAKQIADGELDAGLVPIFEALRTPNYAVVDEVAIACDGPVYSVFLCHQKPIEEIRSITLDPGSLTSVHLLQVLLAEYYGLRPQCLEGSATADAQLLIGNQAIDYRQEHPQNHQYLDLGTEWKARTGLPFVFAVWLLRPNLPNLSEVAHAFRALQQAGLPQIEQIVKRETFQDEPFRRRYLNEHIRFGLGEREKLGIEKFAELLFRHGFVPELRTLQYQ